MTLKCDLHIHSTLSPCGSLYSSPKAIVNKALEQNLDIIAITDHNSTLNLPALQKAAKDKITAFYGVEVQTLSETHLLSIFDSIKNAMDFGLIISKHLPEVKNNPEYFGDQVIVDENENILSVEDRLLLQSVSLDVETVIDYVHKLKGLVFASHIDRDTFSIISQLGFIPQDLMLDGIEISKDISMEKARHLFPDYCKKYPVIRNSDAHYLKEIGSCFTIFEIEEAAISEISMALKNKNGRTYRYDA